MNENERRLLRSYTGGPRIWDATVLLPLVTSLQTQGLIEPSPGHEPACQLSAKGRQALEATSFHAELTEREERS